VSLYSADHLPSHHLLICQHVVDEDEQKSAMKPNRYLEDTKKKVKKNAEKKAMLNKQLEELYKLDFEDVVCAHVSLHFVLTFSLLFGCHFLFLCSFPPQSIHLPLNFFPFSLTSNLRSEILLFGSSIRRSRRPRLVSQRTIFSSAMTRSSTKSLRSSTSPPTVTTSVRPRRGEGTPMRMMVPANMEEMYPPRVDTTTTITREVDSITTTTTTENTKSSTTKMECHTLTIANTAVVMDLHLLLGPLGTRTRTKPTTTTKLASRPGRRKRRRTSALVPERDCSKLPKSKRRLVMRASP